MHKLICIVMLLSISSAATSLLAQRLSAQLSVGVARTGLYNQPAVITAYDEGGFPLSQSASFAPNVNLSLFRKLTERVSLMAGVGIGQYAYTETGMQGNGGPGFSPYTGPTGWTFIEFSGGYRHVFSPEKKTSFLVESGVLYDWNSSDFSPVDGGFALQQKIGTTSKLTEDSRLTVTIFFKSGVSRYNEPRYGNAYMPYAYGIQVGVIGRK